MMSSPRMPATNQSHFHVSDSENCTVLDANISIARANQQLISHETELVLYMIHAVGFIPVLFLIGVPLNVVNLAVFFRQGLSDRINVCLFTLSLLDFIYLILILVFSAARAYWRWGHGEWADAVYRYSYDTYLIALYGISYGPYLLSAIISTERCVCILFPLKARQCISTKALVMIIVTGVLTMSCLFFLVAVQYKVVCVYLEHTHTVEWAISHSQFHFRHKTIVDIVEKYFFGFTVVIGSTVVVLITTIITSVRLQQIVHWRGQASVSRLSKKEIGVVKTIIYLSVEFIILSMPKIFLRLSQIVDPQLGYDGVYRHTFLVLINLSELSSYISSVVNFFVYYFSGSKYRETLHSMLPSKSSCKKSS